MRPDAWKQAHDLFERYTKAVKPRPDIEIVAHACDRGVELRVGELLLRPDVIHKYDWSSTGRRNVDTMREVAEAILDACDFVEQSNPTWAKGGPS